jgi:hypothetical protein
MGLMRAKDQEAVRKAFAEITRPVHLRRRRSSSWSGAERADHGLRFAVMSVPKTVIDELVHIEGPAPEGVLLEKLGEAMLAGLSR